MHTLGTEKFLERMDTAEVDGWMALGSLGSLVSLLRRLRLNRLLARIIIALQGWTPLIITVTKNA